ncbi:MAG: putative lyase [Phycisphaerales bacterium]|nr:putative lyase [Phycisphaerales bacterium]
MRSVPSLLRRIAAGLLCSTFLLAGAQGCASSSSNNDADRAARAQREGNPAAAHRQDLPYYNDAYNDAEEDSGNIVLRGLAMAGSGIYSAGALAIDVPVRGIAWLNGDRPGAAARLMEDPASPDNRRTGMNKLADTDFIQVASFRKRCREVAQYDKDASVRATALRTSNRARDSKATPVFIKSLEDPNEWVRLEAAKALVNVPDVEAAAPLSKILGNREENRDVRIAAADALKHYRTLAAVRALTSALNEREFGISWQARNSLKYLTARDYGFDESAWLAYFTGPEKPLG